MSSSTAASASSSSTAAGPAKKMAPTASSARNGSHRASKKNKNGSNRTSNDPRSLLDTSSIHKKSLPAIGKRDAPDTRPFPKPASALDLKNKFKSFEQDLHVAKAKDAKMTIDRLPNASQIKELEKKGWKSASQWRNVGLSGSSLERVEQSNKLPGHVEQRTRSVLSGSSLGSNASSSNASSRGEIAKSSANKESSTPVHIASVHYLRASRPELSTGTA
jgi:hypothetical protein